MLKRGDAGHRLLPKPRKSAPRAAARSRSRSRRKKSTRAAAGARSPSYRSRDSSSHCHRDRRRGSTGVPRPRPPPGEPPPSQKKVAPAPRPPPPLPPAPPQPRPRDLAVKPRGSVGVSSKRRRCLEKSPDSPSASESPQLYIGATPKSKATPPSKKAAADRTGTILKARSPYAAGKKNARDSKRRAAGHVPTARHVRTPSGWALVRHDVRSRQRS